MSLPPVNYETIKYNDEFQAYLFDNRRDLYVALWAAKFDISGMPPEQQKRICLIYKQFIEAKENWFPAKRASKINAPIPARDEIREWVKLRIDIFGEKGKTAYHAGTMPGRKVCFRNSREDIIEKSAEKLTLVLEKISKKFPTMINILLHNMSARFVITPGGGDIVMNKSGGAAGNHVQARGRHWLMLKEDDIFGTEEAGESTITEEIFHLMDYSAVDTSVGEIETCRQELITYSNILDKRLNGQTH